MRVNSRIASFPKVKTTHEGAVAYVGNSEEQLRRTVLACLLWEKGFYEDGQTVVDRICSLVPKLPFETVAKIAIEAREQQKLRHAPLMILVACFGAFDGKKVGDLVARVIQRPDEAGELIALYRQKPGVKSTLPRQLKIGIARALRKFDNYQLAKWDTGNAQYSLANVIHLCHVRAGGDVEFGKRLAKLANKTFIPAAVMEQYGIAANDPIRLETPNTWETRLSAGEDKAAVFADLIQSKQIGALAMLRNLRNMIESGVPADVIRQGLASVKVDRVLPFRFIAASKYAPQFEPELQDLMLRCMEGSTKMAGRTVLLIDVSASMTWEISSKSQLNRLDAAIGLAIILREICEDVDILTFSERLARVPLRRGFALGDAIDKSQHHGGTALGKAVSTVAQMAHDRLIVITDEQSYDPVGSPPAIGYMVNVASNENGVGYGDWTRITGWSESIARFILEKEQSRSA